MRSSRLSGSTRIMSAPAGLQEGCIAVMTAQRIDPQHRPDQGGCLELAPGLEPGSAVYKTVANRPWCAGACCPGSSGRVSRPASTLLTGPIVRGGMTSRMTPDASWLLRPADAPRKLALLRWGPRQSVARPMSAGEVSGHVGDVDRATCDLQGGQLGSGKGRASLLIGPVLV